MTCKDCLHYDRCMDYLYKQFPNYKGRDVITEGVCEHFKNKADFVEVVKCPECKFSHYNKYAFVYSCKRRDYFSEYLRPTDFCSYGERKDAE